MTIEGTRKEEVIFWWTECPGVCLG